MARTSGLLVSALALAACTPAPKPAVPAVSSAPRTDDWYRNVVFYELWVRSFQDSNGDGIGDLPGLVSRLDYLADLGVGALWLMPTFPSPLSDSGYDVSDFEGVHPDYGTLDDLKRLVAEAHLRNLKVLLDFVPNHTSVEHPWFKESRASRTGPRADWYVWSDGPGPACAEADIGFGAERWTLDPVRGQYYFHQAFPFQPDLNFRAAGVQEALLGAARFWLDAGVDGFRIDSAQELFEAWPKCWHEPETFGFYQRLRALLDEYPSRAMVGETCCEQSDVLRYLGDGKDMMHLAFDFTVMNDIPGASKSGDALALKADLAFAAANDRAPARFATNFGNHDIFRSTTMVGSTPASLRLAALALLTLPGAPFVYYGEELGMTDGTEWPIDFRDAARTPMQWDDSPNQGFTTGTPFLPLSSSGHLNVASELPREDSLLGTYRRYVALRNRTPALQEGTYEAVPATSAGLVVFWRRHAEGDRLVVLSFAPTADTAVTVQLPTGWAGASSLTELLSGQTVGDVAGGSWSAQVPARTGWVLGPTGG